MNHEEHDGYTLSLQSEDMAIGQLQELEPDDERVFALEVQALEHDLLEMASRAESMVGQAADALSRMDVPLAHLVITSDDEVDQLDLDIEIRCLRLLGLRPPNVSDIRLIGTALKMITDIERVADLAVDIAKCSLKIDKAMVEPDFVDLYGITFAARSMFREAIEAFVRRDLERCESVAHREVEVDALYRELRDQIHHHMQTDPDSAVAASWMLLAVHHLERIADHALNVAERVAFMITGELRQLDAEQAQAPRLEPS